MSKPRSWNREVSDDRRSTIDDRRHPLNHFRCVSQAITSGFPSG
ncbi:hypothetical protein RSSM_04299 [Rhodopirellula sallentina SM41]|uniref:Uncharacterized protein n=1 Tax=Rhodopirellula sallentina SM41 TaxID=1263870 RepID=M5UE82_9BACT|nr:hypothetical protein RSSM_04299 [Rhodopirellula sallentina SM41]